MGKKYEEEGHQVVEVSPLEMVRMTLELGGEPAQTIANVPDEAILDLLNTVETIKVIMPDK